MSNNLNQLATVANATKEFKLVSWEVQARRKGDETSIFRRRFDRYSAEYY